MDAYIPIWNRAGNKVIDDQVEHRHVDPPYFARVITYKDKKGNEHKVDASYITSEKYAELLKELGHE